MRVCVCVCVYVCVCVCYSAINLDTTANWLYRFKSSSYIVITYLSLNNFDITMNIQNIWLVLLYNTRSFKAHTLTRVLYSSSCVCVAHQCECIIALWVDMKLIIIRCTLHVCSE